MAYKNIEDCKAYHKRWYKKNRIKRIKQILDSRKKRASDNKAILIKKLGGKCEICGYDKCIKALDFHHNNGDKKDHLSKMLWDGYSLEKLLQEIKKCKLVCANCHREIHANGN